MVLCHGTPWSSRLWRPIAETLAAEYSVYLWDLPGFGESSKRADHDVSLASHGELFAHLLDRWGLASPHVVAHDIGGAVALRAHLLHGAAVASLTLVDVVVLRPWGSDFFRLVAQHPDVFSALPPAVHRGMLGAYIAGATHRGLSLAQREELLGPWLSDAGRRAFSAQIRDADEAHTAEFEPLLGRVAVPTTVLWGEADAWIPVERGRALADAIPGARFEAIPDAGHLVQLDAPERLTAGILRALAVSARAETPPRGAGRGAPATAR